MARLSVSIRKESGLTVRGLVKELFSEPVILENTDTKVFFGAFTVPGSAGFGESLFGSHQ